MGNDTFTINRVGTTGHEILADGEVIAWTTEGYWALMIAALLNRVETEGLAHKDIPGCDTRPTGT
jgi:hypothetical protein